MHTTTDTLPAHIALARSYRARVAALTNTDVPAHIALARSFRARVAALVAAPPAQA